MANSNSTAVAVDETDHDSVEDRLDGVVMALSDVMAQLGVLKLAIGGLWFADTPMGKGRPEITGATFLRSAGTDRQDGWRASRADQRASGR